MFSTSVDDSASAVVAYLAVEITFVLFFSSGLSNSSIQTGSSATEEPVFDLISENVSFSKTTAIERL